MKKFIINGLISIPLTYLTAFCMDFLFETDLFDNLWILYIVIWILIPSFKLYLKRI